MRVRALIVRIIRQFLHDRRTLALLIIVPLAVLSLVYLVFDGDTYRPRIGAVGAKDSAMPDILGPYAEVAMFDSGEEAEAALAGREIDAIVRLEGGSPRVKLEGSDPARNRAVTAAVQSAMRDLAALRHQALSVPLPDFRISARRTGHVDLRQPQPRADRPVRLLLRVPDRGRILPAGADRRHAGAAARHPAAPLGDRGRLYGGFRHFYKPAGGADRGLCRRRAREHDGRIVRLGDPDHAAAVADRAESRHVPVRVRRYGADTEYQMIQFIPLVIVPQVFFSGLFDLGSISPWLRWLTHVTPLKYGADALRDVMIRGEGWNAIRFEVFVLLGLSVAFMAANVFALRKHRKI